MSNFLNNIISTMVNPRRLKSPKSPAEKRAKKSKEEEDTPPNPDNPDPSHTDPLGLAATEEINKLLNDDHYDLFKEEQSTEQQRAINNIPRRSPDNKHQNYHTTIDEEYQTANEVLAELLGNSKPTETTTTTASNSEEEEGEKGSRKRQHYQCIPAPIFNRDTDIHAIKIHYIQTDTIEEIPDFTMTKFYRLQPAQRLPLILNKMRNDNPHLTLETFAQYMARMFDSEARAPYVIRRQGILDPTTTVITIMYSGHSKMISTTEARIDPATIKISRDHSSDQHTTQSNTITATVYYSGEYRRKQQDTENLTRQISGLNAYRDKLRDAPHMNLMRFLNNIAPTSTGRQRRPPTDRARSPQRSPQRDEMTTGGDLRRQPPLKKTGVKARFTKMDEKPRH